MTSNPQLFLKISMEPQTITRLSHLNNFKTAFVGEKKKNWAQTETALKVHLLKIVSLFAIIHYHHAQ